MADRQLSFVPAEGQPPNPFLEPRNWAIVLGMAAGVLPSLTESMIAKLSGLLSAVVAFGLYAWGKYRSGQRTQVVDATLKAVSTVTYGDTAAVNMPNGSTQDVKVTPANETPPKGTP